MKLAIVKIEGLTPMAQCRPHDEPRLNKESADDYEKRTWIEKAHYKGDIAQVPPLALKNAIGDGAKYLSIKIPGKGKATYTKHFEAGVMVFDPSPILDAEGKPITRDRMVFQTIFVPSDGVSGSGKRVNKRFPVYPVGWNCTTEFYIMDDLITRDVFMNVLTQTGSLIGVGSFRVRNKGIFGRFKPTLIEWREGIS